MTGFPVKDNDSWPCTDDCGGVSGDEPLGCCDSGSAGGSCELPWEPVSLRDCEY